MRTKLLLALSFCVASYFTSAADVITTPSQLKTVTVYRMGAEMTHTANALLKQGTTELVIEGISSQVDLNSVQITCPSQVTLLSFEFSNNYLVNAVLTPRLQLLTDSLERLQKEADRINLSLTTSLELLDVLKANKELKGTAAGLSVAELTKLMDYYKTKSLEVQNDILQWREKKKKKEADIEKITNQIEEEKKRNTVSGGRLLLQLAATAGGKADFTITYLSKNAYWIPFYDIKVESIEKPLQVIHKAKIVQTTGIDWKQVKLSLSTAIPNQMGNAPVFNSWFLSYAYPVYKEQLQNQVTANRIQSRVTAPFSETEEAAIVPSVINEKKDLEDYLTIKDNALNVTFDIAIPYDVPTNGKEQTATLQQTTVGSRYKYYSAPKLDKEAYLLAEVPDWEALNLLPGEANVIFEGTYVGKSYIDPNSTADTLNLTLGRDKRVVVTRTKLADYSSTKFLGNNKLQQFTYEITVKNNKKETVHMLLKDQFPLTTNKDIEVELKEASGAAINNDMGVATWPLTLAPGETKKLRISYSVKYPKDKVLNLN
jgi:uncharacterized protein (TIGR02231 family)